MRIITKDISYYGFHIALLFIGLLFVGLDNQIEDALGIDKSSEILLSVGGVLIGVGISNFLQIFKIKNLHDEIIDNIDTHQESVDESVSSILKQLIEAQDVQAKRLDTQTKLLKKYLQSRIKSREEEITQFKRNWHGYYLTDNKNGRPVWMYYKIDFSSSLNPGELICPVEIVPPNNAMNMEIKEYTHIGFKYDSRSPLIIHIVNPLDSSELGNLAFFPYTQTTQDALYGFCYIEGWSTKHIAAPFILSKEPLIKRKEIGEVTFKSHKKALKDEWVKFFKSKNASLLIDDKFLDK